MTLGDYWIEKESWKSQLPMIWSYCTQYDADIDLANMINKCDTLTLDFAKSSGFKELDLFKIPSARIFDTEEKHTEGILDIAMELLERLRNYLEKIWDPKILHVIFLSGGTDSRILTYLLYEMEQEGIDLGHFLFISHEPEIEYRKAHRLLDTLGWKYVHHIYKPFHKNKPDYYRFGIMNPNAFFGPNLDGYSEIVIDDLLLDMKECCLVAGYYGGEIFNYPSGNPYNLMEKSKRNVKYIDEELLRFYGRDVSMGLYEYYFHWGDLILPYLNYDYLEYAFKIPSEHFYIDPHTGLDAIRYSMLKCLGDDFDVVNEKHSYNLNFIKNKDKIRGNWKNCQFRKDFSDQLHHIKPEENFFPSNILDAKLYGLSLVYEQAKRSPLWDTLN